MAEDINQILADIFQNESLIMVALSSPKDCKDGGKSLIRPIFLKGALRYQWTDFHLQQALHQNLTKEECKAALHERIWNFKQTFLYTLTADYQILIGKKSNMTILKKPPSKQPIPQTHNRPKHYLLAEGKPVPFLVELGIMKAEGKIYPQKRDKFRQVNRFLEMVEDVLPALAYSNSIHIVDFGCGKAYLTFALYHYLKEVKGWNVTLEGVDLKADVIKACQALAKKLGYTGLTFALGNIHQYQQASSVDMVVSLHACDIATDAALEKAIHWQAKVILSVPCCQHELYKQVSNASLNPLLKHGILKERFAALATDAARAQLLEVLGYQTQILEFIDVEHTPKNLLIRAIRQAKANPSQEAWQAYLSFKHSLHIHPALERYMQSQLP